MLLREYAKFDEENNCYMPGSYDQRWYFDNGEVFFIYMTDPNTDEEYRLYFENGTLVKWIDPNGNSYSSEYRWDEMQSFYAYAQAQCEWACNQ